jgi:chorismate dehydratase
MPLRISIVQYLNTAPLVRGFTHGPLRDKYRLAFTVPSECAEALRRGAADIAIIPAIEYQRMDNLAVIPNLSIASKTSVRSLLLISKVPIQKARRIALDRSSRSTQALVRILCAKHWQIAAEFFETEPDLPTMLTSADAALLIGDPALRLSLDAESVARRGEAGNLAFPAELAGIDSRGWVYLYDIVESWRAYANLPAVLAVWAARRDVVTPEVVQDFQASLEFGLRHLEQISAEASRELQLPADKLQHYLRENIDYSLDDENIHGLQRYYKLAAEMGLITELKPLEVGGLEKAREVAVRHS